MPEMKNFWLTTMTMADKSSCAIPTATGFSAMKAGNGQPHITPPMEIYINTARKPSDAIRRRRRTGVSLSASASSLFAGEAAVSAPFMLAP